MVVRIVRNRTKEKYTSCSTKVFDSLGTKYIVKTTFDPARFLLAFAQCSYWPLIMSSTFLLLNRDNGGSLSTHRNTEPPEVTRNLHWKLESPSSGDNDMCTILPPISPPLTLAKTWRAWRHGTCISPYGRCGLSRYTLTTVEQDIRRSSRLCYGKIHTVPPDLN